MPSGIFIRKPFTEQHKRNISLAKKGKSIKKSPKSKPMSEEHRKKISLALIGNQYSKGRPAWNKGKKRPKFSTEWRFKMSESRKKRGPYSEETRRKISESHKKDKNPFWKGGISPVNILIREGIEIRLWREKVFKRDNWTCVWCGQIGGKIEADHIKEFAKYPELRFDIDNGRTLCKDCHRRRHKKV